VPVHYDDYRAFRSPLSAFLERAEREGVGSMVTPVVRGQTIELDGRRTSTQ